MQAVEVFGLPGVKKEHPRKGMILTSYGLNI